MDAFLADDDEDDGLELMEEEQERLARFSLHHDDSPTIWRTWYQFGGMDRGISLEEAAHMPETRRRDMTSIMGLFLREKKKRKREKDALNADR